MDFHISIESKRAMVANFSLGVHLLFFPGHIFAPQRLSTKGDVNFLTIWCLCVLGYFNCVLRGWEFQKSTMVPKSTKTGFRGEKRRKRKKKKKRRGWCLEGIVLSLHPVYSRPQMVLAAFSCSLFVLLLCLQWSLLTSCWTRSPLFLV